MSFKFKMTMAGSLGLALAFCGGLLQPSDAFALDLDWSGQFRAETHLIHNYSIDPNAGRTKNTNFQPLFLRLRPKLVVNDNIYIKSEWWVGDPVFGMFGSAMSYTPDQRQFYSSQSRGATISAQRIWAEFLSDVGTIQVGRAPLNWGLGIVWNSGDGLWDRYLSTGDVVRLVSKFGAFSFSPAIVRYSIGNTIAGACYMTTGTVCTPVSGTGGISDYSIIFKYENPDEDFEGGVNFVRRIAGPAQDPQSGFLTFGKDNVTGGQATGGGNFNTWDIYGRKKWGRFSLAGELPIVSGDLATAEYTTYALAVEGGWKMSDSWDATIRAGHAPGQPNMGSTSPDKFRAFYMNPNYKLGLIMFNYQLANLSGVSTLNNSQTEASVLKSPFDNPIVNANYLLVGGGFHTDKWTFRGTFVMAQAQVTAESGLYNFNNLTHQYSLNNGPKQSSFLGWEVDLGTTFLWDDAFQFDLDLGWFMPGDYYKYTGTTAQRSPSSVLAGSIRAGVVF